MRKLLMTMFGWNDSGGGTLLPRLIAKELVRRGWEVSVFHAATAQLADVGPYALREWEDDGVRLIGVHNRRSALFDIGHPDRDLDEPAVRLAFRAELAKSRHDVVHFHNLHNLGALLIDEAFAAGVPAHFTAHNYWLACPRVYLMDGSGQICPGPGDGSRCATCVGSADTHMHERRLAEIRARAIRGLRSVHAISDAVRRTLLAVGYPAELVDVVRQTTPQVREIWEQVGAHRPAGRRGEDLTVAFVGSALPHKGPQLLIQAAQRTHTRIRVRILGEVPRVFADRLRALDRRGVMEVHGSFAPSELPRLLADADVAALPSTMWDGANLAAEECHAARLPLVVPRLGGLPEAVRDGIDGLTFAGLDVDDLTRQLERLAGEAGLLERLQAAIEPPDTFGQLVDQLEAYYAGDRPGAIEGSGPRTPPTVRWQGDHGQPTSLSIINDRVTERLPGPVQRVTREGRALDAPLPHLADVEVRHQWPPDLTRPTAGRLAVIQPWEFGSVPRDWLPDISGHVDELWVPSEYVRRMYLDGGVHADRVVAIPNGVDLDEFSAYGPAMTLPDNAPGTKFLFVGGLVWRKSPDVLLEAWREAFAGRDDVTLVIKDFGADGVYRNGNRDEIRAHAQAGALPRILLLDDELTTAELAALYRACDVLVHPYRGEGFAMPVLEAMACGLPVIATAGGPTDEFCPVDAGWRIRSRRFEFPAARLETIETAGRPWVLEPDRAHLVELLRAAADADPAERRRRGQLARAAAERLSWDAVAALYEKRLRSLAERQPLHTGGREPEPFPLSGESRVRMLATPAWRAEDRLGDLLAAWSAATARATSASLYLLADPDIDGTPAELEARVLAAAAHSGADIDAGADIDVLMEPFRPDRDARLHRAVDVYVPVHAACAGHERLARAAGNRVLAVADLADAVAPFHTRVAA